MKGHEFRIVTLIPSATEIVAALGLADRIVGRSHECDWPEGIERLPPLTRPRFETGRPSGEIHRSVKALLDAALGVYDLDTDLLESLKPTHIVTQTRCEVCSVSLPEVEAAVAQLTHRPSEIISLEPRRLTDVLADIRRVGAAFGVDAGPVVRDLEARIDSLARRTAALREDARKSVACIEWDDPLMAAGNWVPELVSLAGGRDLFGQAGEHAPLLEWEALKAADPEVVVFMPCGYDLERTERAARSLLRRPGWRSLSASKAGEIYASDGSQYFNRPGPRLVDSAEILAEILHPGGADPDYEGTGWRRLDPGAVGGSGPK